MLERTQVLTRDELAARLGVHRHTIDRYCREGVGSPPVRLRRQRLGGRVVFDPADVETWQKAVNARTEPAPSPVRKRRRQSGSEDAKRYLREQGML